MNRRSFLKGLLGVAGTLALAPLAKWIPAPPPPQLVPPVPVPNPLDAIEVTIPEGYLLCDGSLVPNLPPTLFNHFSSFDEALIQAYQRDIEKACGLPSDFLSPLESTATEIRIKQEKAVMATPDS